MATTSLWRIKGSIGDVIRYAENKEKTVKEILPEEKAREPTGPGAKSDSSLDQLISYASREEATNQRQLVTGINCSPERARQEMTAVKKAFGKTGGTIAYHGYQSFAEGEVTRRHTRSASNWRTNSGETDSRCLSQHISISSLICTIISC